MRFFSIYYAKVAILKARQLTTQENSASELILFLANSLSVKSFPFPVFSCRVLIQHNNYSRALNDQQKISFLKKN
jgi:hypothetical protein